MFSCACVRFSQRVLTSYVPRMSSRSRRAKGFFTGIAASSFVSGAMVVSCASAHVEEPPFDIRALRTDIENMISDNLELGPSLIRLAWHDAASYDCFQKDGSPNSASMRFKPECLYNGNKGLEIPREALEPLKRKYPQISYADLWVLASYVAIEYMGGPTIPYCWGRVDARDGSVCGPDGRLPDGSKTQSHVREVFTRLGFNDQETVALIGAHTCGECHMKFSGFHGPWTHDKNGFDNSFFTQLLNEDWVVNPKVEKMQLMDLATTTLMMLPSDTSLLLDPTYRRYVELYAKDNDRFNEDFGKAFKKLTELGIKNLHEAPETGS